MDAKHLFGFAVICVGLGSVVWRVRAITASPETDILRIKRDYESPTRKVTRVKRMGAGGLRPGHPIYRMYAIEVTDEEVGVFEATVGVEMTSVSDPEVRTFRNTRRL